jgi:AcrR family transcriptional regulator
MMQDNPPHSPAPPAPSTQARLLMIARDMFWRRGYSNVPLRDIARAAGVDVALISRYFGGKLGLFTQTLAGAFDIFPSAQPALSMARDTLIDFVVGEFARVTEAGPNARATVLDMIAMNSHDPEVGPMVVAQQRQFFHVPLVQILGSDARAEIFMAAMIGHCMAQSANQPLGQDPIFSPQNAAQLRHMLQAAAQFNG